MSPVLDSILISKENDTIKKRLYTQLFETYEKQNNYTQLGADAHELAKWFYRKKNKKNTIYYTELAIEAKKKAIPFDRELLKNSYINLGYFHNKYENYHKAIKALKKAVPLKKHSLNIRAYNYLANIYYKLQDPYNSVENRLKIFQYLDPIKDRQKIIDNHINIGVSYRDMGVKTRKQVIRHLLLADSLSKSADKPNLDDEYVITSNIAIVFHQYGDEEYIKTGTTKNLLKAISYYKKAIIIAKKIKRKDYLSSSYYNLGLAYIEINADIAENYFDSSLKLINHKTQLLKSIYYGYGKAAYKKKQYDKAIGLYQQSIAGFFNIKNPEKNWHPIQKQLVELEKKWLLLG
ncbi:hypothetical protein J8L88_23385, partial [Aquimarina sp. MMG015]|uniref:hypothetical protein n=1 Tax=Aquimarina sp. MMG015 TaxID=2822689 RepID=UPI001B39FA24